MGRWVAVWALSGCNLATNAVRPSTDRFPADSGTTTGSAVADDVFISEIVDGEDEVKFVELFNPTDEDIDLTSYEIRRYSNGQDFPTEPSLEFDGVIALAGKPFVISGLFAPFDVTYDVDADVVSPETIQGNGNDAYELVYALGGAVEVIDVYGVIGEDGAGTDWDYDRKSARRLPDVISGRVVFDVDEWEITRWGTATPGER